MAVAQHRGQIIDAHNHPDWLGFNLERVLANMDAQGIARTWLLSWSSPADECDPGYLSCTPAEVLGLADGPIPFARCLAYQERASGRFVLGYAPDPRRPGAVEKLRAAIEIYGVRVCGEVKLRMMYDNPDALALFRFCGERQVPVTVHLDYPIPVAGGYPRADYWYGGGLDAFDRALRQCPETRFLGHAPGFWAHISDDAQYDKEYYPGGQVLPGGQVPELLRACPNLYGDLSGFSGRNALSRDPAFAREFILEFQDRLLFARDNFDNHLQTLLDELDLPDTVLAKLLYQNALQLAPDV